LAGGRPEDHHAANRHRHRLSRLPASLVSIASILVGKEVIKKISQESEVIEFYLWKKNWRAYRYFSELNDQWLYAGMGELVALNGAFAYQWIKDDMPRNTKKAKKYYRQVQQIAAGYVEEIRQQNQD